MDPNRVGGPTNALLGENSLSTTIGAAGGLANDAASNALRRMAARSAACGCMLAHFCICMQECLKWPAALASAICCAVHAMC